MLKVLLKKVWWVVGCCAVIGGAISFVQLFTTGDDYGLTIYLKSIEKVIENDSKTPGIRILFNGKEVTSLYLNKIELKNTGKKALTKDFIYEPVTIKADASNVIYQINPPNPFIIFTADKVIIKWDLLNPGEVIDATVFTKKPLKIKTIQQIREITKVEFVDEIANPPTKDRLKSLGILWLLLFVLSIYITLEALLLVKGDVKLGRILNLAESLRTSENVDRKSFLEELARLYDDYYQSVPLLFVKPDELIDIISKKLDQTDKISGHYLEIAREGILEYSMHGNLYFVRSIGIFFGPLLFGFCLIRVGIALII